MWRALAALAPIIGVAIRSTDRRLQRRLRQAQAFSPDRAVSIADNSPLVRWRMAHLRNAGVIRPAAGERYYWNEAAWAAYRRARRLRALTILAVMLLILAFLRWHGLIREPI